MKINTQTLQTQKFNLTAKKETGDNDMKDRVTLSLKPDDIGIMRKSISALKASSMYATDEAGIGVIGGLASGIMAPALMATAINGGPSEKLLALTMFGVLTAVGGGMEATHVEGSFVKGALAAGTITAGAGIASAAISVIPSPFSPLVKTGMMVATVIGSMVAGGIVEYNLAKEKEEKWNNKH